jgi:hypothetical protein
MFKGAIKPITAKTVTAKTEQVIKNQIKEIYLYMYM